MQNVMLTHQDHEEEGSSAKRRKVLSPNEAPQEILLHNYISPARDGDANVVTQSLVNPAVDPNWIRFGWTPLLIAAANGREGVVRALLRDERSDPNYADRNGYTPMIYAACNGHASTVSLLLEDPRVDSTAAENGNGDTALSLAAGNGHAVVIDLILGDERVDPNVVNAQGNTALLLAVTNGHVDSVWALVNDERVDVHVAHAVR